MTVLWIEKGPDVLARRWPQDLDKKANSAVLTPIPRTNMWWLEGYAWSNFGGGDATNSGGPNYLGLQRPKQEPYRPVDVYKLRNNSIIPPTATSSRWIKAFNESKFEEVLEDNGQPGPLKTRQGSRNRVGLLSSLRTPDGRERLLLANDLRYSDNHKVTYVHARVTSIIHDNHRATGVRGVRIDGDQGEYGGCVTWHASKAVVLAGGVFNSFDLLVESGIGPEEFLEVREIPEQWRLPNELVGKKVGDEHVSVFLSVEPEKQNQYGAEARLVAENGDDSSYERWSTGVYTWVQFKSYFFNKLLGTILPDKVPGLYQLVRRILKRASLFCVSIDAGPDASPVLSLIAVKKPNNSTAAYKKNPLGVKINDSAFTFTDEMCRKLTNALKPFKKGAQLQREAHKKPSFARIVIAAGSFLGLTNFMKPIPITAQNVNSYTGKGKNKGNQCKLDMLASHYHFYGGNADVVDAEYKVKNVNGLFISDASIIHRLAPGAPCSGIMEEGMKVADAVIRWLVKEGVCVVDARTRED
jgi:hypothetical protein